ncbi:MAG: hypothetical protein OXF25_04375 [Cyanobacteria bacterium MAG CAR3_bin_5]|nr:hypothetical protein [Cyanobacteria bacterium MAG CAR3_bin_5]
MSDGHFSVDGPLRGGGASHGPQPDIAAVMLPARGGARPMAPPLGWLRRGGSPHTVPVGWPPGRWNRKQPITMTTPSWDANRSLPTPCHPDTHTHLGPDTPPHILPLKLL